MKTNQRIFARLLSFVLCLCLLAGGATVALAEEPSLLPNQPVTVTLEPENSTIFKITVEEDGWYSVRSISDTDPYAYLFNSTWDEICFNDDTEDDFDFFLKEKLYQGYTYYLEVGGYHGETAQFEIVLEEAFAAESVEITSPPTRDTVVEGYENDTYDLAGLEVCFTLTDGTTVDWSYDEDSSVAGSDVMTWVDTDGSGHYYYDITCDDAFERQFFTTIENPVESIAYMGDPFIFYENSYGSYDENYTDSEGNPIYFYNYASNYITEALIDIRYNDGTSEEIYCIEEGIYDAVKWWDTQTETPWTVGGDNVIHVSYLGVQTTIPVTVLPCPYTKVELTSDPVRQYVYKDLDVGYMNGDTQYIMPDDLTGAVFTATLTDGTTQEITAEDMDFDTWTIDGYPFMIATIPVEGPGEYEGCLTYKGWDFCYPVTVIESPIASLEVVKDADRLNYNYFFYPLLQGMQVKVTLKDGTSETVTVNQSDLSYEFDERFIMMFDVLGYTVNVECRYDGDLEYYQFSCLDVICNYYGFVMEKAPDATSLEVGEFYQDIKGSKITVHLEDGDSFQTTLNPVYSYGDGNYAEGFSLDDDMGIGFYSVLVERDENGNLEGYSLYFYDREVFIPLEDAISNMGDVTGNGKIGADDALEVLKIVVGKAANTPAVQAVADVNRDGEIGADDALEILKKVVGKPACF